MADPEYREEQEETFVCEYCKEEYSIEERTYADDSNAEGKYPEICLECAREEGG